MDDNQEILFYEELRSIRKSKNIEINEISENTKINVEYLKAIEDGNFDSLPYIYVRLFIKSYAEYLNIDSELILEKFQTHLKIKPKKKHDKTI